MALNVILTTAYFPPIQYFSEIINSENIYIETNENYSRQSYRNRCHILSCNGILPLSIPIIRQTNGENNISQIKIDYSTDWQRLHINAIISAYGKSPFFEYYSETIINNIKQKNELLIELNNNIVLSIFEILKIKNKLNKTERFIKEYTKETRDLRYTIHPKKSMSEDTVLLNNKYIQTFSDRFSFIPNLSVLDLIFNVGPDSINYLKQ
jgi:hypothetical protein